MWMMPPPAPHSAAVQELASEARTRLRLGKGGYRREHVRAFAQRVQVADDAIYIKGNKNVLLRTLVATKGGKTAGIGVPGFIPKWRTGRDWPRSEQTPVKSIAYELPLSALCTTPVASGHLSFDRAARRFCQPVCAGRQAFSADRSPTEDCFPDDALSEPAFSNWPETLGV